VGGVRCVVLAAWWILLLGAALGCNGHVRPIPGPLFEPAKLPAEPRNDSSTLKLIQSQIHARYGVDPPNGLPLLSAERRDGGPATAPGGTTTIGMGEVAVSVAYVPAKPQPATIHAHVLSLPAEAQRALLGGSDETRRAPDDVRGILAKISQEEKPAPPTDYGRPRYAATITSQIFTTNPYDRFNLIETLLVLDAHAAPNATIAAFETTQNSELEVKFGQVTREEGTSVKLTGNISSPLPFPGSAGSAGVSGEYARTWSEKLVRDLAEKIATTNVYRVSDPSLEDRGLWVVQRGHKDHKLTHSLAQVFTVDLTKVGDPKVRAKRWWRLDKDQLLRLTEGHVPDRNLDLRMHVFSLGEIRHIESEDTSWASNEPHTVEEGDDETRRYVITNYQHVRLPVERPREYLVRVQKADPVDGEPFPLLTIWQAAPTEQQPAVFDTVEEAHKLIRAVASIGAWQDGVAGQPDWRAFPHANVFGVHVTIDGVQDRGEVNALLPSLHVIED